MNQVPRGLRNNNPLNLRISPTPWVGKLAVNTDGSFEQFDTLHNGIRAAVLNYRTRLIRSCSRCPVLRLLVASWAPAADGNDVARYVDAVASISGVSTADFLDYRDRQQTCRVLQAMAVVEVGEMLPISDFLSAYDDVARLRSDTW